MRQRIHTLLVAFYVMLVRYDACPCALAARLDRAVYGCAHAISRALAAFGRLCRPLDGLITADDGVCAAGCTGCAEAA